MLAAHSCRRTDIVDMFFSIANSIRRKGENFKVCVLPDGSTVYTFRIGSKRITYSIQEGGQA